MMAKKLRGLLVENDFMIYIKPSTPFLFFLSIIFITDPTNVSSRGTFMCPLARYDLIVRIR